LPFWVAWPGPGEVELIPAEIYIYYCRAWLTQGEWIGLTALIPAAENGHTTTVGLLLDKGTDIEAKDKDSYTALMVAAQNGHTATVGLLLDKGADIEAKDNEGLTALETARRFGHKSIVEALQRCVLFCRRATQMYTRQRVFAPHIDN
jgi:hypothetical protein